MTESRLNALQEKHRAADNQLCEAMKHPVSDEQRIRALKLRKLRLKDQIHGH